MYIYSYEENIFSIRDGILHIIKSDENRNVGIIPHYLKNNLNLENIIKIYSNQYADFFLTNSNKVYIISEYNSSSDKILEKILSNVKDLHVLDDKIAYINTNNELYYYNPILYNKEKRSNNYADIKYLYIHDSVVSCTLYDNLLYFITNDGSLYKYEPIYDIYKPGCTYDDDKAVKYNKQMLFRSNVVSVSINCTYIYIIDNEQKLSMYNHNLEGGFVINNEKFVYAKKIFSSDDVVFVIDLHDNLWKLNNQIKFEYIKPNINTVYVSKNFYYYI